MYKQIQVLPVIFVIQVILMIESEKSVDGGVRYARNIDWLVTTAPLLVSTAAPHPSSSFLSSLLVLTHMVLKRYAYSIV